MAEVGCKTAGKLEEFTRCGICLNVINGPTMLPCSHTFCLDCLNRTAKAAHIRRGEYTPIPCPMCRRSFIIPRDGVSGLQRNFLMQDLIDFRTENALEKRSKSNHCEKHSEQPLDLYCTECKKVVCAQCFDDSHSSHSVKHVTIMEEEFRQTIQEKKAKLVRHIQKLTSHTKKLKRRNTEFQTNVAKIKREIKNREKELTNLIDKRKRSVLKQLFLKTKPHSINTEKEEQEMRKCRIFLQDLLTNFTDLTTKGSASEICESVDELTRKGEEAERLYDAFRNRPYENVKVSYKVGGFDLSQSDVIGQIEVEREDGVRYENFAIYAGTNNDEFESEEVIKINLRLPNDISNLPELPTKKKKVPSATLR